MEGLHSMDAKFGHSLRNSIHLFDWEVGEARSVSQSLL